MATGRRRRNSAAQPERFRRTSTGPSWTCCWPRPRLQAVPDADLLDRRSTPRPTRPSPTSRSLPGHLAEACRSTSTSTAKSPDHRAPGPHRELSIGRCRVSPMCRRRSQGARTEAPLVHQRDRPPVGVEPDPRPAAAAGEPAGPRGALGDRPRSTRTRAGQGGRRRSRAPSFAEWRLPANEPIPCECGLHGPLDQRSPGGPPWRAASTATPRTPASLTRLVLLIGDGRMPPVGTRLHHRESGADSSALGVSGGPPSRAPTAAPFARRDTHGGAAGVRHRHGVGGPVAGCKSPRPGAAPRFRATGRPSTSTARHRSPRHRSRRRTPRRYDPLPAYLGGHGYFPAGCRAPDRDRRAVRRARTADRPGPGDGHPGRAVGSLDRGPGADRPRRPGADRDAGLPQRRRADPRRRRQAGDHRGRPRRPGPRRHRGHAPPWWRRDWPT